MRLPTLLIAGLFFLGAAIALAFSQTADDKKKDPDLLTKDKEHPKITADTPVNGKTLDQWIALIHAKDRSQTEVAIKSIIAYGPELAKKAVPELIAELKKHSVNTPIDMSVRVNASVALGLILSSQEKPDQTQVQDTVAILRKMLKDPQVIVKLRVGQAVAQMGPLAKEAIPELVKLVKDFDTWETRHVAVVALGTVGSEKKGGPQAQVVEALFTGLKDSSVKVRLSALQSLNNIGTADSAEKARFLRELDKMAVEDSDPVCRLRAHVSAYPILKTAAEREKRAEKVSKFLDHSEPQVRIEAAQALGHIGYDAKKEIPHLIKTLNDKDLVVMGWAIWALGRMEKAALAAVPKLETIAADHKMPEGFRETAKEAVEVITGKKKVESKKGSDK
jgi:HEAT repeat protein